MEPIDFFAIRTRPQEAGPHSVSAIVPLQAVLRGHTETIDPRMQADAAAFVPLPPAPYDACHKVATRVS